MNHIDKSINDAIRNVKHEEPLLCFSLWVSTVFIWRSFEVYIEAIETEPYELDGTTPLITLRIGWVEIMFESKQLYRIIYKRKWGFTPLGLKENK